MLFHLVVVATAARSEAQRGPGHASDEPGGALGTRRTPRIAAATNMAEQKAASPASQRFMVGAVTTRLTVTVPAGIVGGELVRVAAPDGSYHSVVVPAGLSAGQQFSVELLAGHADSSAVEPRGCASSSRPSATCGETCSRRRCARARRWSSCSSSGCAPPPPARRPRPPRRPPGPSAHPRAAAAGGRPRVLPRLHQAPARCVEHLTHQE